MLDAKSRKKFQNPLYFFRVAMPPRMWRWALLTSSTSLTCKYSARLKRGSRSEMSLWTVDLLMPNLAWLTGPSLPLENWQRALTVPHFVNLAPWL